MFLLLKLDLRMRFSFPFSFFSELSKIRMLLGSLTSPDLMSEFCCVLYLYRIFLYQKIYLLMMDWSCVSKEMVVGISWLCVPAQIGILLVIQPALTLQKANGSQWVAPFLLDGAFYGQSNYQWLIMFPVPSNTQIRVPFSSLRPIFRARTVTDAPPFDPRNIISLQARLLVFF